MNQTGIFEFYNFYSETKSKICILLLTLKPLVERRVPIKSLKLQ